jgi:hypothetical protein
MEDKQMTTPRELLNSDKFIKVKIPTCPCIEMPISEYIIHALRWLILPISAVLIAGVVYLIFQPEFTIELKLCLGITALLWSYILKKTL